MTPTEVANYLADWQPSKASDRQAWPSHFVVAKDGTGTHTRLQDAIDNLPDVNSGAGRTFILIKPGEYREIV